VDDIYAIAWLKGWIKTPALYVEQRHLEYKYSTTELSLFEKPTPSMTET